MADVEKPGIFERLKRRSVFRVGAMYVVAAWVLLQVADVLADPFSFPDWFQTTLIGALIIGFPITLVLAWIFDVTPDGVVRSTEDSRLELLRLRRGHKIDYAIIGTLVIALALAYFRTPGQIDSATMPATPSVETIPDIEIPPSIAVLPFVNMSDDPSQDYFSDGITEDILNALVQNSHMKVIARTSSFQFKGKNQDIREIGAKLNVTHVLEGSVRKSGNRIRVTAQLDNTADGTHMWSDQYDRELTDIFEVQDELVAAILKSLNVHLDNQSYRSKLPQNMGAYDATLIGRQLFNQLKFTKAIASFEKAVSLSPDYAPAYAYLALSYERLMINGQVSRPEAMTLMRSYTSQALKLDPHSPIALVSAANNHFWLDGNYEKGLEEAGSLLRMYPNYVDALIIYSWMMIAIGHVDDALFATNKIIELDPLNADAYQIKGMSLVFLTQRTDEARLVLEKCEELGANSLYTLTLLAFVERDAAGIQQQLDRGDSYWQSLEVLKQEWPADIAYLNGDKKRVLELVEQSEQSWPNMPFFNRMINARLSGDMEQAIELYGEALSARNPHAILQVHAKAYYENLFPGFYTHPKYQQLLKEHGLDQESIGKMRIPNMPF